MDNLRLILIISGVILLAGIYVWGVAFAKRQDSRIIEDDVPDSLEDDLDNIQDVRAARNIDALIDLENFDIDEDLDRDVPPGEPLGERKPKPADIESEANDISADDTDEIIVDADIEDDDEPPVRVDEEDEDEDIPDLSNIDFEPKADDLSGIRATHAADDEVPIGQLDLLRLDEENDRPAARAPDKAARRDKKPKRAKAETTAVAITVMAREGQRFSGADLRRWLQSLDLEHGEMAIYHRRKGDKSRRTPPVYSVANVIRPGTFDPGAMAEMTTPGVVMFVQLPGPDDPGAAFEEMIRAARKIAEGLDGVVCDETRSTLSGQAINHMRERISEFSRRQRIRH